MSYLAPLRLHFAGKFQANIPTGNNDVRRLRRNSKPVRVGGYNPDGDCAWRLVGCRITAAYNVKGLPLEAGSDPVLSLFIADSDRNAPAKLVDLDPLQQTAPTIFGLEVRLCDQSGRTIVRGKFTPASMIDAFTNRAPDEPTPDGRLGAAFQSTLTQLEWTESYVERGSFRGWLMNLTRWRITDKFRERQRAARLLATPGRDAAPGEDHTATIERVPDPAADAGDAAWEEEWRHHVFDAALTRLARRVPAKHFQAFELYHRQGWSVMKVAKELSLNPATVYVISHRLTKQLKEEVATLQTQLG